MTSTQAMVATIFQTADVFGVIKSVGKIRTFS